MATIGSVEEAVAWVDHVGVALLYPNPDYVLPSLWEAVAGQVEIEWAVRDADGKFLAFTPAMDKVWRWKDELPAKRLACVGLHVARTSSVIAPRLVAALLTLAGRSSSPDDFGEVEGLERDVAQASLELGRPASRRELRIIVGTDKRRCDRAVNALQQKLVLTNAGRTDEESGWPSTLHDLFARRWRARLRNVPQRERALAALAEAVLAGSGDVSAADLAAALRIRRREANEVLEALEAHGRAVRHDEDGIAVWRAVSPAQAPAA
ncbi:MAG: hypothetical protein ICV59_03045 [Thermoleophilia bacterium]|nr:hypothetical protein [Thermoleophilia bacterium]